MEDDPLPARSEPELDDFPAGEAWDVEAAEPDSVFDDSELDPLLDVDAESEVSADLDLPPSRESLR